MMEASNQAAQIESKATFAGDREAEVNQQIAHLWSVQKEQAAAARRTKEELKILRRNLAERLHEMKSLLVQSGRGGRWASYLRGHKLPRATADRYVQQHEATLAPAEKKRLSEAFSAPTEEDVHRLFKKLLPNMRRVLTTQEAAFMFVAEMICGLPGILGDVTDAGAQVFRPEEEAISMPKVQHDPLRALQVVA